MLTPTRTILLPLLLACVLGGVAPAAAAPTQGEAPPVAGTGAIRPVPGPVVRPFQAPTHAYGPGHRGVDLAATPGQAVRAAMDGRIAFAGQVAGTGWVTVDHGGGLVTTYGPVEDRRPAGTSVPRGSTIGRVASPAEGPPLVRHLDWGARLHGEYIDPMALLQRWRLRLTTDVPGLAVTS